MHARDQSSIFSAGGKFCPDYGLLLELHALTLVTRSCALLIESHNKACAVSTTVATTVLTLTHHRMVKLGKQDIAYYNISCMTVSHFKTWDTISRKMTKILYGYCS